MRGRKLKLSMREDTAPSPISGLLARNRNSSKWPRLRHQSAGKGHGKRFEECPKREVMGHWRGNIINRPRESRPADRLLRYSQMQGQMTVIYPYILTTFVDPHVRAERRVAGLRRKRYKPFSACNACQAAKRQVSKCLLGLQRWSPPQNERGPSPEARGRPRYLGGATSMARRVLGSDRWEIRPRRTE